MKTTPNMVACASGAALALAGGIAIVRWWGSCSPWQLREHLQTISPLFLECTFGLIVIALILNTANLMQLFSGVPRRAWHAVMVIAAAGLLLTAAVAPRQHRIYYDEDIYGNIAQNITFLKKAGMCNEGVNAYGEYSCHRLEYNKQPNAWPHIISVVYRITGVHELPAFLANNAIFALAIIVVFCTGFLLFQSTAPALYAAGIFALIPQNIIWSNSMAVEPGAGLFAGLTVLATLAFIRLRDARSLFLCAALAAYASQFRTESIMLIALPALIILLYARDEWKRGRMYLCLSIAFVLLIPHLTHLYSVRAESWGASGSKLAMDYFAENFRVNSLFYFENTRFPLLFTLLFAAGLLLPRRCCAATGAIHPPEGLLSRLRRGWREKIILTLWFLSAWGIFLFFYAGSYNYGVDVRYSLISYMPLALVAGHGAGALISLGAGRFRLPCLHPIACAVIALSCISFMPLIRAEGEQTWSARADHRFARECAAQVPDDAIILTHNPNMFLLWGKSAAQASLATEQPRYFNGFFHRYKGGVYFHYNFWCNVTDPLQNSFCTNILQRYDCTEIAAHQERTYRFALYRVERKRPALPADTARAGTLHSNGLNLQ